MTSPDKPPSVQDGEPTLPEPWNRTVTGLHDQVARHAFHVALTLQDTAAIAVDPLVRRRIETALGDLDHIIQLVRDAAFAREHHVAGPGPGERLSTVQVADGLVRYWLSHGESALDLATAALTRLDELGAESASDVAVLRSKIGILHQMVNGHEGPELDVRSPA
jgi:hypothetical protein